MMRIRSGKVTRNMTATYVTAGSFLCLCTNEPRHNITYQTARAPSEDSSGCASDQSSLSAWSRFRLRIECAAKTLIRLRLGAGWSECLLVAPAHLLEVLCLGSNLIYKTCRCVGFNIKYEFIWRRTPFWNSFLIFPRKWTWLFHVN